MIHLVNVKYRSGGGTPRHPFDKSIPFEFTVKIPQPLKRGLDYGFKRKKL